MKIGVIMSNSTNQVTLDYTKLTHADIVNDFIQRVKNDSRFANLSSASIFQLLVESIAGVLDMSNYYIQRTAEESFSDTARLDSSMIKLSHNKGYQPRRPIPAHATIGVQLKGPLPSKLKAGDNIWFNNNDLVLSYSKNNYLLDHSYSYTLTANDISNGTSSTWAKTIQYSVPANMKDGYIELNGTKSYKTGNLSNIKVIQGDKKTTTIYAKDNVDSMSTQYQFYDIDDLTFSDYIGERDYFATKDSETVKENGICKIGLSNDKDNPFQTLFSIELINAYLNSDVLAYNGTTDTPESPLAVCRVYSNQDKTVRIEFGDGSVISNGFNNIDEFLTVEYLSTVGASANKSGSTNDLLTCSNKFYAIGDDIIDVTSNISFIILSDVTGGCDFESLKKMQINSSLFSGRGLSLISLKDYRSYLLTLSDPITVTNSSVFGEYEVENNGEVDEQHELQNILLYSISNNFYRNSDFVNIFDNDYADNSYSNLMLYGTRTEYLEHIVDLFKLLKAPTAFYNYQYGTTSNSLVTKFQTIQSLIKDKTEVSSSLYSIPPIVHYFDVVGTIKVNKTYEIQSAKTEIEDSLYEWLSDTITFNTSVYKSDIVKKILENDNINSISIDIKPSSLLKSEDLDFVYTLDNEDTDNSDIEFDYINSDDESTENTAIEAEIETLEVEKEAAITTYNTYKSSPSSSMQSLASAALTSITTISAKIAALQTQLASSSYYNVIIFSTSDSESNTLASSDLEDKTFTLKITNNSTNVVQTVTSNSSNITLVDDQLTVTLSNKIYLDLSGTSYTIDLTVSSENDLFSLSNLLNGSTYSDGNVSIKSSTIVGYLNTYLSNLSVQNTADRAIKLPYYLYANEAYGHKETFEKLGTDVYNMKQFYYSMLPSLLNSIGITLSTDDFENSSWVVFNDMTVALYELLAASLADSVLDDNNNITNYSLPNEIPVIRMNQIEYTY